MRLSEVAEAALDDSIDLPDTVEMTPEAFERYYPDWLLYIGTGRKFLPQTGGLNDQNSVQMKVILELDSYYSKVLAQIKDTKDASEV